MTNPARKRFRPLLSAYVDGELSPEERREVEAHLAVNKESAMEVADLRAAAGILRLSLEQKADEEDWKDFSGNVMSRLVPEKLPFFERLQLSASEMFTYNRPVMLTASLAGAFAAAVAVAVTLQVAPRVGYGQERLEVQAVKVEQGAHVAPVVMQTDNGDAIIWTVETRTDAGPRAPDDERSEELQLKQGEL